MNLNDTRPKALDLFCCAGGATKGLQLAGFHVTGVDRVRSPRYCGDAFIQADALEVSLDGYDFIWASPPCQRYTPGAAKWGTSKDHPHLIPPIRQRLITSGLPFAIENVAAARKHLRNPVMLCGTMFGLGVFRHRLFETSFLIMQPDHSPHVGKIGDGKYQTVTGHAGGSSKRDGWKAGGVAEWRSGALRWESTGWLVTSSPRQYRHRTPSSLEGKLWRAYRSDTLPRMEINTLKMWYGYLLLLILGALICLVALGEVNKETSYGLDGLITGLLMLIQQWASWAFNRRNDKPQKSLPQGDAGIV